MKLLRFVLLLIVISTVSCSGGASTPTDAAKTWLEAFLRVDVNTLRDMTCLAQRPVIQEPLIRQVVDTLGIGGTQFDLSALTYTFNQANSTIAVGGTLGITRDGARLDIPLTSIGLSILTVVQEQSKWRVCIDPFRLLG